MAGEPARGDAAPPSESPPPWVAMSLAVATAAAASGHRTCYVANDRTRKSPVYYGVVEIVPEGVDSPPTPESH